MRYYAYKCGPTFTCGRTGKKPCAWGAVKVMLAFACLARRTAHTAIDAPSSKAWISCWAPIRLGRIIPPDRGKKPAGDLWCRLPVFYVTISANRGGLVGLARCRPRLANALQLIRRSRNAQGRWALEYDYTGKIWVDFWP